MPPTLNCCNLPRCHLRRIGPRGTMANAPDIMDFHRVTYVIGRNPATMDFVLDSDDEQQSKMISRCHARVVRQADNIHRLYDDSMNGMFVNNIKISDTAVLNEGDHVTFGHLKGAKLAAGTKVRQPASEYQFLFERCHCQPVRKELDATIGADEDTISKDMPDVSCESSMPSEVCADKSVTIGKLQADRTSSATTADVNATTRIVNQITQPLINDRDFMDDSASAITSKDSEVDVHKRLSKNLESRSVPRDNEESEKQRSPEQERKEATAPEYRSVQEFNLPFDSESDEEVESDLLTCCTQKILSGSSVESTALTTVNVNKKDECKRSPMVGETDQVLTTVMDTLLTDVEAMEVTVQEDAVLRDKVLEVSAEACSSVSLKSWMGLEVAAPVNKSEKLDKDCMTTENGFAREISKDNVSHNGGDDAETLPDMELKPREHASFQILMGKSTETGSSVPNANQRTLTESPQNIGSNVDTCSTKAETVTAPRVSSEAACGLPDDAHPDERRDETREVAESQTDLISKALRSDVTDNTTKDDLCSENASKHGEHYPESESDSANEKCGSPEYESESDSAVEKCGSPEYESESDSADEKCGSPEYFMPEYYDAEQTLQPMDSFDNDDTPPLSYNSDESVFKSPIVPLLKKIVCIKGTLFGDNASRDDNGNVSLLHMDDSDVTPAMYDNDVTPAKDDNDVTPAMDDNDVTPAMDDNDVTPPMDDNDVTPAMDDNDVTPAMDDNDVTPAMDDNDVTPPMDDNDVTPAMDDNDVTPAMDDGDVTPPMSDFSDFEDNDIDLTHCTLFTDNVENQNSSKIISNDLTVSFNENNIAQQTLNAVESLQQSIADGPLTETLATDVTTCTQKMIVAIPYHFDIREKLLDTRTTPPKRKHITEGSDTLTSFSTAISAESPAKRQKLMTDFSFKSPYPKTRPSVMTGDNCDDMLVDPETDEIHSTQSIQAMSDSQFTNAAERLDVKIEKGSRSNESRNKARKILERLRQKRKSAAKPTNLSAPESHPGTSDDSAFQDELSHDEEMTTHLVSYEGNRPTDRINEYTTRCSDILKLMQRKLRGMVTQRTNPKVQAWMKALDDLDAKRKLPDTVIAVVGDTGAGKSSLMNAILDHANILPTSGMRACTAVVVEVVENSRNKNYEAEIIFLSKQEWQQELEMLLNDLSSPDGKVRRGQPDPKTEAGVAFSKIRAVYGKVAELKVLSRITTITGWLGRTKHISTRRAADFRQQIDCYIESTDLGTGGQYWPIVKHVKVLIPNCDVCSSGAILVDLPGVRDSNAARDKIAKEYLKNCNTVWVVASIHRAIDDRTAKDLLGESFRRQLLMDGQYGSVAFVCTKTDVLTPSEIIGSLHIEAECEPLEREISELEVEKYNYERDERTGLKELKNMKKELKTMEDECEELQVDLAEAQSLLEHTDSEGDDNNDEREQLDELESDLHEKEMCINETRTSIASKEESISRLPPKILELESGIISQRKLLTAMCAKARNEYSKKQIRNDFKAGLREMKRKAAMGDGHDDSDDEDDWLADDDDESDHEIGSSANNLEVFCVSSTEYQKMRKLLKDGPPQVFSTLEETQIPTLKAHVHKMTAVRRRQGAERLIRNLGQFLFDLESYITDDGTESEGTRTNAKFAIDDHFKRIDEKFSPILSKLSSDINDIFDHSLGSKLQIGVTNAISESENSCAKWGAPRNKENRQAGGLHHCTYKATCNRYGVYTSPSFGPIDFNDQLAGPMCTAMMVCWDKVFSGILWALLERTCASIQQAFVNFTGEICMELNELGVHIDRVERVNTQLLNTAKNKLTEMMGNLKVHITEKQRAVSRTVVPNIQESMKPIYTQCQGERGCGMFARMKDAMSLGISYKKDTMYSAASLAMLEQLCDLQVDIVDMVKAVCSTLCVELRASYEPLWEAPESARRLRIALHTDVTELCDKIRVLYNDASIALPERKALIKRDVPPPRPSVAQNIINSAPTMHPEVINSALTIRPGMMTSALTIRPGMMTSASTIRPGMISASTIRPGMMTSASTIPPGVIKSVPNICPGIIRCVRVEKPDIPATVNTIPSCRPQTIGKVVTPITVSNLQPKYNQPDNVLHLSAADVLLMSEIDMLNKVDEIRRALLIHRMDMPKCVECLEALTTLSITSNMLLKNPYVMETIKKCRKFVGSELVRSKAEVVYQKLRRLPGQAERQVTTNSKENQANKTKPELITIVKGTSQNSVLQLKKEISNANVKTEDVSEAYCTMFANNNLGRKIKQEPAIEQKPNMGGSQQSPIIVIDMADYQPIKQEPGIRSKGRKRHREYDKDRPVGMMDLTTD